MHPAAPSLEETRRPNNHSTNLPYGAHMADDQNTSHHGGLKQEAEGLL